MRGNCSITHARHRPGFTLVELVISAGLALFVISAAMTMAWSASRESVLTAADRTTSLRGSALVRRLTNSIHSARAVQVDSATQITIWEIDDYPSAGTGGPPGDDLAQVSEVDTLAYDSTNKRIVRTYVDFTGASGATISLLNTSLGIPGAVSINLGSTLGSVGGLAPYTKTESWAEQVQSCAFASINKNSQAVNLVFDCTIGTGAGIQTYHKTISIPGPAYFDSNSAARTQDGVSGGRYRQKTAWTW